MYSKKMAAEKALTLQQSDLRFYLEAVVTQKPFSLRVVVPFFPDTYTHTHTHKWDN